MLPSATCSEISCWMAAIVARHSRYAANQHQQVRVGKKRLADTFTDPGLDIGAFLAEFRAFVPSAPVAPPGPSAGAALTPRQLTVLREVAHGLTDKEIARKLSLSPRTVEMHVANALAALDCRTRAEAVRRATELKLVD